jgi:hypothetical protein
VDVVFADTIIFSTVKMTKVIISFMVTKIVIGGAYCCMSGSHSLEEICWYTFSAMQLQLSTCKPATCICMGLKIVVIAGLVFALCKLLLFL